MENYKTTHSSGQTYLQDVVVYKRFQISLFTKNVFEYKVCGRQWKVVACNGCLQMKDQQYNIIIFTYRSVVSFPGLDTEL